MYAEGGQRHGGIADGCRVHPWAVGAGLLHGQGWAVRGMSSRAPPSRAQAARAEQAKSREAARTAAIDRNQRIVALANCPPTAHDRAAAVEALLALMAEEQAAMSEVNWATVMDRLARLVRFHPELVDSLRQDARFLTTESTLLHTMLAHAAPRVCKPSSRACVAV